LTADLRHSDDAALAVSVVICAYTEDRWEDLVAAVESARRQSVLPQEVLVVVDHNPGLLARARANLPCLVTENNGPRGLSGARNSGVAIAQGDLIAFLDDDAMAAPDWLERLIAAYRDEHTIGVGGAVEPLWSVEQPPRWFPDEFLWVVGCTYRGMPQRDGMVRNTIGANMSFRREAFEVAGGFQQGVGQVGASLHRCDDTEFCIRLSQCCPGRHFRYEPAARVHHRVPASRANWRYFRERCYTEGESKALIARLVGSQDGLAAERVYAVRVLPWGIARNLADSLLRRDPMGVARAGAIALGLAFTLAGYVAGTLASRLSAARARWQLSDRLRLGAVK
jgi:glucosyl-dolichyl phosphate glucuronosyltransferase